MNKGHGGFVVPTPIQLVGEIVVTFEGNGKTKLFIATDVAVDDCRIKRMYKMEGIVYTTLYVRDFEPVVNVTLDR
jgi:hypothetical protein